MTHDLLAVYRRQIGTTSMGPAESIGVESLASFGAMGEACDGPDNSCRGGEILRVAVATAVDRGIGVKLRNFPGNWAHTADKCRVLLLALDPRNFDCIRDVGTLCEAEPVPFMHG
ncbi:MAG: hypothetical protein HUJ24_13725 [Rhodobacteraceae bacterium]|nr:hypothetical protein [Paracoccaceae bacterium]